MKNEKFVPMAAIIYVAALTLLMTLSLFGCFEITAKGYSTLELILGATILLNVVEIRNKINGKTVG